MSTKHNLFPISIDTTWQHADELEFSLSLRNWLLDPASLTARLKQHCNDFQVELLGEVVEQCSASEASAYIKAGDEVLVREVLLWCDDKPQVFARSLLPLTSLTGEQAELADLGNKSLGQVLFNRKNLKRKAIEVSQVKIAGRMLALINDLSLSLTHPLAARRSTFFSDNKPFMVAEVFLPGALAYEEHL